MITDEHFSPSLGTELEAYVRAGDVTGAHHLARYLWLVDALSSMRGVSSVLDAGCGAGYGSYLLATRFPRINITAVDYDAGAIREALGSFSAPNLSFRVGDLMSWRETIGNQLFDLVVSFDSIEHIPHREVALQNIVDHLSSRGRLVLSTPCGMPDNDLYPGWSAHRIEYGTASLYDFLRRYFRIIRRPENLTLPVPRVFAALNAAGLHYLNWMNPVICESPIRFWNPHRTRSNRLIESISWQRIRDWRNLLIELAVKVRRRLP